MAIYKILKDDEEVNTIVAGPDFVEDYCTENGFTFEEVTEDSQNPTTPEPTAMDLMLALLGESRYETE